jgi:hypothetical protein
MVLSKFKYGRNYDKLTTMDWLWQGLLSNLISALLIAGVGIVVSILKAKNVRFLPSLMYGLAASTLTGLLIVALNVQHKLVIEQKSMTTVENVQEKVRSSLENFRLTVRNDPDKSSYFKYVVTLKNNNKVSILRPKDKENYLVLKATLVPDTTTKNVLDKFSEIQHSELLIQLMAEASKRDVTINIEPNLEGIQLEKRIPITAELTEYVLIETIDYMDGTMVLLRNTIAHHLIRFTNKPDV